MESEEVSMIVNGQWVLTPGTKDALEEPVITTDATPTILQSWRWPNGMSGVVELCVMGRTAAGVSAHYIRRAAFKKGIAGASVAQIGTTQDVFTAEDVAGWDCTLTASGEEVRIVVTGAAATTIRWMPIKAESPHSRNWQP